MKRRALELVFIALFTFSCDAVDSEVESVPKSICQQIYDKISSCVGGRVPYEGGGCDQDLARSLLELDCESILEEIR